MSDLDLTPWGLEFEAATHLGGEVDTTWKITCHGTRYALRRSDDERQLDLHHRVLAALDNLDGVAAPRVVRAADGRAVVPDGAGWALLTTWVDGTPIGRLRRPPVTVLRSWGAAAARVSGALRALAPEHVPAAHGWDFPSAVETARRFSTGPEVRSWLSIDAIEELWHDRAHVAVHHDLHDENVLVGSNLGEVAVTGVIDVGDVVAAPPVAELAVATAYAMRLDLPPLAVVAEMARGWCDVISLDDLELRVLHSLATARLLHALEHWTVSARTDPYAVGRRNGLEAALQKATSVPVAVAHAAAAAAAGRPLPPAPIAVRWPGPAGITGGHLQPCTTARRRSGHDEPATLRLGVEVAGDPPEVHAGHLRTRTVTGGTQVQVWSIEPHPDLPWAVRPSEAIAWAHACPDLGMTADRRTDVVTLRARHFAPSQRAYYDDPPVMDRAAGMWFTDEHGRRYLDAVNNVTHLGHGHPDVVAAGVAQMARLNTNSRFVYRGLAAYAERLTSTLPDGLDVVFFCCTGSEANDLALRISRTVTGRKHVAVLGGAYHGNTSSVTDISPNRFDGPGGRGAPETTIVLDQPDRYRGAYRGTGEQVAGRYIADATATLRTGPAPAAVFAEALMGTGGQVVLPPGYLAAVFATARDRGALCVSDEVQVGFGRLGSSFWGFETEGVVPDIVTMGKPMGNGHPMSAVVTTTEIARAFDDGMRYFNTFGGNPVSCAIGQAVLDVLERDQLQANAAAVGAHLLGLLADLRDRYEIVGDVRGRGLYLGLELVRDRTTLEPATLAARRVAERLMEEGIITYPNGASDNVLKLKPPMVASKADAELIADTFDLVLGSGW